MDRGSTHGAAHGCLEDITAWALKHTQKKFNTKRLHSIFTHHPNFLGIELTVFSFHLFFCAIFMPYLCTVTENVNLALMPML